MAQVQLHTGWPTTNIFSLIILVARNEDFSKEKDKL